MENNQLITQENGMMEKATNSYCSLTVESADDKAKLFNLTNSPKYRLKDFINKRISIKDVFIEEVQFIDEETGEATQGKRTVIIDKNGDGYATSSNGIFNAISKLFQIFGFPNEWEKPIDIEIKQKSISVDKNILTFELV